MTPSFTQAVLRVLSFDHGAVISEECFARLDTWDWHRGIPWLDGGGIALYFWRRVQQIGMEHALPSGVRAQFERRHADNSRRTLAMIEEWKEVQNLLSAERIRCVMLKGLATIPDYCPDPSLRVQFDHDILTETNSLPRIEELLLTRGYRRKALRENDRAVFTPARPAAATFRVPADSYSPALLRPVEIHLKLWDPEEEGFPLNLPEDLLVRSTSRAWGSLTFEALSHEDCLLFEGLHTFRHIAHNWCRLSHLYEISCFLHGHRSDRAFWQRFCARLENNLPLRRVTGLVFTLAASVFRVPDPLAEGPSEFLALTPELQLWIDRYGRASAAANFSNNKFGLFMLRAFIKDPARWRQICRRRLLPFQLPHRPAAPGQHTNPSAWVASLKYGKRIASRFLFHTRTALRYAWECPRWYFLKRYQRGTYSLSATKTLAQDRRTAKSDLAIAKSRS